MEAEKAEVLQTVQESIQAIEAKYAPRLEKACQALAEREKEVKAEVAKTSKSARAGGVHAIFYRGAVTWDSKGLAKYADMNPEVLQFRKVGAPRVAIRYK
jgi:hypothetical protein